MKIVIGPTRPNCLYTKTNGLSLLVFFGLGPVSTMETINYFLVIYYYICDTFEGWIELISIKLTIKKRSLNKIQTGNRK